MEKKYFILPVLLFAVVIATYLYTKKPISVQPEVNNGNTVQNTGNNAPTTVSDKSSYQSNLSLELSNPKDGVTVGTPTINLTGKTSPSADVFVNDKQLKADAMGNFSTSISLDEGNNSIDVVANDANGNSAEKQITVILESTQ